MPDASGRFKGYALSDKGRDAYIRTFGCPADRGLPCYCTGSCHRQVTSRQPRANLQH